MTQLMTYDTTLRDGAQMQGINFSVEDKRRIVLKLDELGIDYAECGRPGSNPKDEEFFKIIKKEKLKHIKIVAFGSTRHAKNTAEEDRNLVTLVEAQPDAVTIFGKSRDLHVTNALKISLEENLTMIQDSVAYLKAHIKEVFFDAEHFFDGYKANPDYAIQVLNAAAAGGADVLVLADTNGGSMYYEIADIMQKVQQQIDLPLGIHAHNDAGMALANSIEAIRQGAVQVQGTMNGYGERTGNANLCVILPTLNFKLGMKRFENNIEKLTRTSRFVSEIANMAHPDNMPYVGDGVFAHKSGIHVNAVMKDSRTYEHIAPELVGNKRKILVSELSGRSNIIYKANELGITLHKDDAVVKDVIALVKEYENQGYEFEGADASFELLLKQAMNTRSYPFDVINFRMIIESSETQNDMLSEATVKIQVGEEIIHTVTDGDGPVNALDGALRKGLMSYYPELENIELIDYKVRVLNSKAATAAKVRVLIETKNKKTGETWGTVGVSENIIQASWEALIESMEYFLQR